MCCSAECSNAKVRRVFLLSVLHGLASVAGLGAPWPPSTKKGTGITHELLNRLESLITTVANAIFAADMAADGVADTGEVLSRIAFLFGTRIWSQFLVDRFVGKIGRVLAVV